ncbi:hypothetical protein OOT46_08705 [Aquabacterium sp. A7-Y]|uniref:hypothetical protein n=1 Tax=Aquabacterium sp. A7-Y TaxID=1349605 RepID=UPI00223CFEF2|nr:hypothetical protein [Aquabacterium sp. A7-Y]MCW7537928.1 hypothetical protein [Aquabacterium sp. A7-Y]
MKTVWYSPPNARDLCYEIRYDEQSLAVFLNGTLVETAWFDTDGLANAGLEPVLAIGKRLVQKRHPVPQASRGWAPPSAPHGRSPLR